MGEDTDNVRSQTAQFRDKFFEIETVTIDNIECLLLEDVQRRFHGVKVLCVNNVQRKFIRNEKGKRSKPLRIVACIGQVVQTMEPEEHPDNSGQVDLHQMHEDIKIVKHTCNLTFANTQEILSQISYVMRQIHSDMALINSVRSWFHTHYKLYFLCECSHEPHEMHVAPHEGYSIKTPQEFIVRYAPYLRTTIKIAQLLLSLGGLVIPQLGSASTAIKHVLPSKFDNDQYYEDMKNQLKMIDSLINRYDNQHKHPDTSVTGQQKSIAAPLQGADLRELESYLERVDNKRSLGNLYQTVTVDGHVRWVCLQHYDEISFNNEMRKYISDFEAMGGKFDLKTKAAVVIQVKITGKNVKMMCEALTKGFNIVELMLQDSSISEDDLKTLLDVIINRSSIRCLRMTNVGVRNFLGMVKYTSAYMVIEFNNQLLKVRLSDVNQGANIPILTQLLQQNKIYKKLDFSASDYLWCEGDFRRCLEENKILTGLTVEHLNNIDIINSIFHLKTNTLNQLKLIGSLCIPSTLSHFCEMLKNNKILHDIDLMDLADFEDETFVINLLRILRDHKSIKSLSLHIQGIRPSDQIESHLIKSLQSDHFMRRLFVPTIPDNARWAQNGVTVAGGHGEGSTNNKLCSPYFLCVVDDDQIGIIADTWNHRIIQWKFGKRNGQVIAGGNGNGNRLDQLHCPTDILIDKETNSFIICDRNNRRVVRWSRHDGTTRGEILIDSTHCYGLAMDDQRYLYVSDFEKHEVRRYQLGDKNGIRIAGGNGRGDDLNQFNYPTHLFVDRQQSVYVSDWHNHRVMKWIKGAKEGIVVAGGQGYGSELTQVYPVGLFVDTLGTVYVADEQNHRVARWPQGAKQGTVIVGGHGSGAEANQFIYPNGLSFDCHNNLYVVDKDNNRVQRFSLE
ncbi:unnamed protein product [Rotaria socialis]